MSDDVIVVTARMNTYEGEYISVPAIVFPVNNLQADGQTLRERLDARTLKSDPIVIAATTDSPKTTIVGVSKGEAAAVAAALVNVKSSDALSRSFSEMVAKNVSLRVEVVQTAPSGFGDGELGRITIPAVEATPGGAQTFNSDTQVTIIVVGSRLNSSFGSDDSFRSVFAHELAHLIRDEGGRFLTDTSGGAYSADGPLQRDLFRGFKEKQFLDAPDIVSNVQQDSSLIFGPQYELTGTDQNNYILGPNFPAQGNITTGNGNDIFLSYGTANVAVTQNGVKLLFTNYIGVVIYPPGTNVSEASLERVGNDLYITYGHIGSPLLADNAVVLLDHFGTGAFYAITAAGDSYDRLRLLRV